MNSIGAIVRRALNRARPRFANPARIGPLSLAIGIAAGVLVSAVGPALPVRADPPEDPAVRLQVIIQSIHVYDDNDWTGAGDMKMFVDFNNTSGAPWTIETPRENGYTYSFQGSTGRNVTFNRVMPLDGDAISGGTTVGAGIPVYGGQHYQLHVAITEQDPRDILNTHMGIVVTDVDAEHNWSIGSHDVRSTDKNGRGGDYQLYYEIRRAPLTDLWVPGFQVAGSPGSEFVCGQIQNAGQEPSGAFGVTLRTEGTIVKQTTLPSLDPGASTWHCFPRSGLPARKHNLVFSLDEARAIPEMEEYNNANVLTVEADPNGTAPATGPGSGGPVTAPSPEPKPIVGPVDLTVRTIKVNDEVPNGKDDCRIGKNQVTVVVKNGGTAESGRFTARLVVDGDDADQDVESVRAGEEREVLFENVQMKKGERTLKAIADAEHAVDETKEDNNERKISVRCTDAA